MHNVSTLQNVSVLFDLQAEVTLLAALLKSPRHFADLGGNFRPDLFVDPENNAAAIRLLELSRARPAYTKTEALEALADLHVGGGISKERVHDILQMPAISSDAALAARKLVGLRLQREIAALGRRLTASAEQRGDPVDLVKTALAGIEAVAKTAPSSIEAAENAGRFAAVVVGMDQIEAKPVSWLWAGRIPRGKVAIVSGDPGLGKSTLTLDIAARKSAGVPWPDTPYTPNPAGGVVLLNAEDDLADTIRPRLDRAGADCTRIRALQAIRMTTHDGKVVELPFNLERDLPRLEDAIEQTPGCELVVIDPVTAYLGETDSHKNAELRALLAPLSDLAARKGVAIVVVSHLNKGSGPAMYRTMGSLAFVAAARAAFTVCKDKADASGVRRFFLPIKNNLGPDNTGLAYALVDGKVQWEKDPVTISADEALSSEPQPRGPKPVLRESATEWLKEMLADGPVAKATVQSEGAAAGFNWKVLQRAAETLNVESEQIGSGKTRSWRLPGAPMQDKKVAASVPSATTCPALTFANPLDPKELTCFPREQDQLFLTGPHLSSMYDPSMRTLNIAPATRPLITRRASAPPVASGAGRHR